MVTITNSTQWTPAVQGLFICGSTDGGMLGFAENSALDDCGARVDTLSFACMKGLEQEIAGVRKPGLEKNENCKSERSSLSRLNRVDEELAYQQVRGMADTIYYDNRFTSVVYGHIKDGEYEEAIRILALQLESFPRSRAALSLLGYSYYHTQDWAKAANSYEKLVRVCPDVDEYRLYYAQSLFKNGAYADASRVAAKLDSAQYSQRITMLQASIRFEQDDVAASRAILNDCLSDDPDTLVAYAAVSFKEGDLEDALAKYSDALDTVGFQADLAYNIALCQYKLKDYEKALVRVSEVIERGLEAHPELSPRDADDDDDIRVMDHSYASALQETQLIEAYNLMAAIEYDRKNAAAAKAALDDMPRRREEDLDPVTLQNQSLVHIDDDATSSFEKLNFLLSNPPFPPETFGNLLLLYCQYGYHDLAADILAENTHLTYDFLSQELFDFLDASIMTTTSPEEAYSKFDALMTQHVQRLRRLTKAISEANLSGDKEDIASTLQDFDAELKRYIPVLMAQSKVHWENGEYATVERLFRQSAEFCGDDEVWKTNLAHVFFMQKSFLDAIRYYEPLFKESSGMLDVGAVGLANLCVSYIMTNQNDKAEEIMALIEREEDDLLLDEPDKQMFHSCIINLVIGTLYCSKGNFDFGISRVCKSLEPYQKKLGADTWFYAKTCLLALAEKLAKQMLTLKDDTVTEILAFLDAVDEHGKEISPALNTASGYDEDIDGVPQQTETISSEARSLKLLMLKLRQ